MAGKIRIRYDRTGQEYKPQLKLLYKYYLLLVSGPGKYYLLLVRGPGAMFVFFYNGLMDNAIIRVVLIMDGWMDG